MRTMLQRKEALIVCLDVGTRFCVVLVLWYSGEYNAAQQQCSRCKYKLAWPQSNLSVKAFGDDIR